MQQESSSDVDEEKFMQSFRYLESLVLTTTSEAVQQSYLDMFTIKDNWRPQTEALTVTLNGKDLSIR